MEKHIVIIGAEKAGIAAGSRLLSAGFDNVTVLEARMTSGVNAECPPSSLSTHFGRTVSLIDWSTATDGGTLIECTDDSAFLADHVICAASLRMLRKHRTTLFTPLLPSAMLGAVEEEDAAAVVSPLHGNSILFATCGTIEGGVREADRLIAMYKSTKESGSNSANTIVNASDSPARVHDVLILGAGLAGLGAATKLSGSGKRFLVLEGHTKAGGRVNTRSMLSPDHSPCADDDDDCRNQNGQGVQTQASANFVDSGAQWLHGKSNRLHTVAMRHDLLADEQSEEGLGSFIRDDGVVLDAYLVKKTDFLVGQILTECEKYARGTTTTTTATGDGCYPASVSSFLLEHFQTYLDGLGDADERQQAQQLLDWHVRFQVIDNSCLSLDDVSAKSWGKYSYNGESCQAHYNFRRGFSSAVEALCSDVGHERFRFGCDIREVRAVDGGRGGFVLRVRCADGSVFWGRHVVCTFSMGSLKYGLSRGLFRPALPELCVQTIRDIGFETINKLFFQFAEPWWGELNGIQLVFKSEHYENNSWTRHISGFDVMRPGPENTLLAWVGGHGALEMERLSDRQIVQDCVALLAQFTGLKVPQPIRHFCTRWNSNPFVRGSYSYISTSCDRNGTTSSLLARPVTDADMRPKNRPAPARNADDDGFHERPLVLFAGEAVHDQYFSTAHGAFLSGIEQASKILDYYRIA